MHAKFRDRSFDLFLNDEKYYIGTKRLKTSRLCRDIFPKFCSEIRYVVGRRLTENYFVPAEVLVLRTGVPSCLYCEDAITSKLNYCILARPQ